MSKRQTVQREGSRSCVRDDKKNGPTQVIFRSGSTVQKRGGGTLVTHRCGHDFKGEERTDEGATFVLRTFENINKTELNIYTHDKPPVFLSGRDAQALLNLLNLHFKEKRS